MMKIRRFKTGKSSIPICRRNWKRQEGREEGLEQGRQEGRQEGIEQGKLDVARNLLGQLNDEAIAQATGLSLEVIATLRQEMTNN